MKIICIGRNYVDHVKELKNELPSEPLIFMKPDSALLRQNQPLYYPAFTENLHHEVEIVLHISKTGKHIEEKFAHKYYDAIGLGIDFTARDLQEALKKKGNPWEIAKGFDGSAVLSDFVLMQDIQNREAINFHLTKNEEIVQQGCTKDLIFSFDILISYISKFFILKRGDIIYTGTPAGVGAVKVGDKLEGFLEGKKMFTCEIK